MNEETIEPLLKLAEKLKCRFDNVKFWKVVRQVLSMYNRKEELLKSRWRMKGNTGSSFGTAAKTNIGTQLRMNTFKPAMTLCKQLLLG